jgi:ABC-type amino acid transport system permease subunit
LITQLGMDIGGYFYLIKGVFPAPQDVYFMICEYISHTLSLLVLMFCYSYIHQRLKMPLFLVGWSLSLGIYYVLLAVLQVTLYNIAVPGLGASYVVYFRNIPVELILIFVLTSLILLALPKRYRKPQWYESKQTLDQSDKM